MNAVAHRLYVRKGLRRGMLSCRNPKRGCESVGCESVGREPPAMNQFPAWGEISRKYSLFLLRISCARKSAS